MYIKVFHYLNEQKERIHIIITFLWGFPGGSDGKESACNAGYPWTEGADGLWSMDSQRVGHNTLINFVPIYKCVLQKRKLILLQLQV